jgi:pimeloyl-ACP methyl ester carboxylesterase
VATRYSAPRRRVPTWVWWLVGGVVLGVAAALLPYVVRSPRPKGLVDAEDLADEDSCFITIDGIRFHYKERGPADATTTLIFLHGFASSLYSWRHIMAALPDRYRLIAFDRPGFGLSGRPLAGDWVGASPYSSQSSALQTIEFMDALGVDQAVLVGHSQGSSISVLVDELIPERVQAMVLVNSPVASPRFRRVPDSLVARLRSITHIEWAAPLIARPFFGRNARAVMGMAYHDPKRLTDETIELELRATRVKDWDRSYVELAPSAAGLHEPEAMAAVSAPTLVIAGRNDHTVPYRDQVRAAQEIPGARLITFEATGHVVPEERPEAFAEVVSDFLDELGL